MFLLTILGITIILASLVCYYVFKFISRPLIKTEIELMKKDGKFDGEEEFMQNFRVARSEWDLVKNVRNTKLSIIFLAAGIIIFVVSLCV